ncbi:siderophore-interacting protein [Caballeronia sp. ATUFL_M1_KS5A]|uniref:siderophore-interacting protein n=1 Tax=Caballeronia sp. ATUFL_M1_KS5A TaxID=2921778 RepID=UPI0020281B30|nr:siderophore-interacting protein [Caballeronia sp. ATUFL_M1_KS5A]
METNIDGIEEARRTYRIRHESRRREVEVLRIDQISPGFRSVTFGGEALADFRSDAFDDHVKLILHDENGDEVKRDFTPRRHHAESRQLTIEFSMHGDGFASNWAASARMGQRAIIAGPRSSVIVPPEYDWYLLIGDDTALPAISRRLEELPHDAIAMVIVEMESRADRRQFRSRALYNVTWTSSGEELLAAVKALNLPSGRGYAWCAAESAISAAAYDVLVNEKGHDRESLRASSYWRR